MTHSNPTSRILEADIVGEEHYEVARKVQEVITEIQRITGYHRYSWYGRVI